ncbi:hypothetical protein [Salinisphaera sp. T31B1]|uniref:hypothetical protein n=1 Tax=Salinisphaera sp. T31B1 TaxID=727963 RepID=UPI00333E6BF5
MNAQSLIAGVTLGYLAAGAAAVALWFGIGIVLLPLMAVAAIIHWHAGRPRVHKQAEPADSHHRWLARHHTLSVLALLLVLIVPLLAIPTLHTSLTTLVNTLAYAPHPAETLAVAWPQLGLGKLMAAGLIATAGWLLVTLWISVRLILRWLRWADRRPA